MLVKGFKQFNEEKVKSVTFTFGRFNPPTVGHGKLLDKVASISTGNDYKIFASKSNDAKKNPLEYSEKIKIMRKMFLKHGRNIVNDKSTSILHAAASLYSQGYTKAKLVVGSDRIKDMSSLLNKYNGVKSKHGFYDFEGGIEVVSAGDRDPDADDVSGMSASKMRAAAVSGDFQSFSNGLPKSFGDKLSVFNLLRKRMGLKEMVNFRKHIQLPTLSEKRERYISGEIFNTGDRVTCQKTNHNFTIAERYSNYVASSIGIKYFINDLEEYIEETVNPKYHAGLSKSTKAKRKAQFKKQAAMDDDNPDAYKPAPGDATAKTKPSKHTKKFKDMFGEDKNPIIDTEGTVEEGVDDPAIFKAVFLAGGPGSGKSFTVGKTGLTALGFKVVNSDDKFEIAMKKADLEPTPDNIFSPKGQKLRSRAKELTAKQQELYLNGRLGLVVDGTGKDYAKIKKQAELLKKLGYDVAMIFVNTDLETAKVRNRMRSRSLPDDEVAKMWQGVQNNLGKFQSMFGSNFVIVDNSEGSNIEKATTSAYKKMAKFAKEEPKNNIARNWIKKQLGESLIAENKTGIQNKAEKTGISYSILKKVFDRGVAAWKTGHRPGTTPSQWGFARINSFATGGKTRTTADKDLWAQHKGKKESIEESKDFEPHWMYDPKTGKKEWAKVKADHDRLNKMGWVHEPTEALDYGTPETTKNFKRNTPGQKIEEGEGKYKGETWEQGYKRRVVKTSDPDHAEKGYKWRIKGKERPEISIKLYKEKPSFKEYSKQMDRVAGHEFGK
jgi:shikimate kinase